MPHASVPRIYPGFRCTFVPFVFSRKAIDAHRDGRDSRESPRNRDCKSLRGLSLRAAARLRPSAARFRRGRNFSDRTCDELSPCLSVPLAEGGCIPRFPWRCRVACDKRVTTAWTTSEIEISRTAASRLRARIIINAATYRHERERKREKEGERGNNWIVECGAVSAPRRACFSSELR